MDISVFTPSTAAAMSEEAVAAMPGTVADGAVFARLLSGLGIAAAVPAIDTASAADTATVETASADVEAPAVDPSLLLLVGHPVPQGAPKTATGEGTTTSTRDASAEPDASAAAEPPTAASLGLPPLLAALVAPTLAQAAPPLPVTAAAAPQPGAPAVSSAPAAPAASIGSTGSDAGGAMLPAAAVPAQAAPAAAASLASAAPIAPAPAAMVTGTPPAADAAQPGLRTTESADAPAAPTPPAAPVQTGLAADAVPQRRADPAAAAPPSTAPVLPSLRRQFAAPLGGDGPAEALRPADGALSLVDIATPASARVATVVPLPAGLEIASAAPASPAAEVAAPAEQLIARHLDMAQEGEWLDQLTRDIVRTAAAEGGLRFKLNPEHLGSLQVEVTQGAAGASVRLTADTEQARTIIADARPQLIAEARAQGLRISEAHVDLNGQGQPQAQAQAGNGGRSGRDAPAPEYLTSWQPESVEEKPATPRRSAAERYA